MKQALRKVVLALLFGVLVYGVFVAVSGYREISESLVTFQWWTFGAALGLASLNYGFRFLKWQYYLRVLRIDGVGIVDSLLIFLSGFVLTITPGKIGEVFKSAVLHETHDIAPERSAPIVVAERLTDVIGVVVLIALGSASFEGGLFWALVGLVLVCVGLVFILWSRPAEWLLQRLETGWMKALVPKLRTALGELRRLSTPTTLLVPALLSVVAWSLEGIALYVLLVGFGQQVLLAPACFFYATATLAGAVTPVPGGLGVTETLIQQQLVRLGGLSAGAATSSMLLVRLATLWWAVLLGFVALGVLRLRFPNLLGTRQSEALP